MEARSPSANRPAIAASPSAASIPVRADHGGQFDGAGHLGADPLRAGRGCLGEPPLRAVADGQESRRGLGPRPRPRLAWPVPAGMVRVVLVADGRAARDRQPVPGDLGRFALR